MPPEKRSKEQTWKEDELKQSLKEINDDRTQGRSTRDKYGGERKGTKESSHRKRGEDGDRRDRGEERIDHGKHRDRGNRDDRHRDSKSDKDRDNRRENERGDRHRESNDRDRNHRDDKDRRHRDENGKDSERRHRDDKESRHRDEEERDSERRHRDDKDRRRRDDKEGDDKERRHRDDKERDSERRHRDDKERDSERRHRDDKERDSERRHRDDKDRRRRDDKEGDDKERRHRDDKERRHRDDKERDSERRHRDDKDRRHRDEDGREKSYRDDRDRKHKDDDGRDRRRRDETGNRHRDEEKEQRRGADRDGKNREDDDRERRRKDKDRRGDEREKRPTDDRKRRDGDDQDRKQRDDGRTQSGNSRDKDRRQDEGKNKSKDSAKGREHKDKDGDGDKRHRSKLQVAGDSGSREGSSRSDRQSAKDSSKKLNAQYGYEEEETYNTNEKPSSVEAPAGDDDDYGGYDDDFEDYDDDFEDDDGGEEELSHQFKTMKSERKKTSNNEMEELFDALNAENERLLADSRKSNFSDATEEGSEDRQQSSHGRPVPSKPKSFINFVAAKQRDMNQKAASKARRRCTELLNIIELDTVHMTLFDLPPVKEYDLYMSSFGRTNAQQVYIQTNDDNLERDTQTEDIDSTCKWTQHPQEGATACGQDTGNDEEETTTSRVDEGRLSSFLQRACQVIEKLINEEQAKSSYSERSSSFSCSEAYVHLRNVEIFQSRRVSTCVFSPTDSSMLLTMHTEPAQVVDRKLDKYGMIGVWNTNSPSQPQKIVASASMPTCCCFSPIKATLVFGGMRDGSLVAWDLREPHTMHHSYICGEQDWLLRFPTYNTAGVLKYDNHNSPISALVPLLTDNVKSTSQESGLGLSFQLASLDRNGTINLWVVAEILETSMAGSESDLGLSPNGKIKLLKSSTISLSGSPKNDLSQSLCALDLKLNPTNHNHMYVATDGGIVLHGTRFGTQKTIPRCYKCDDSTPCTITSVDLHPFGHPVLLAGCEDGSIRLHHLSTESPIIVWEASTNGAAIRRVLWSRNCTYIIFVLDSNSIIHMWDLLRNDAEPMTSDQILSDSNSKVVDICLSEEEQSHTRPKMVLSYADGSVQVHLLSSHVSNLQPGENEQFSRFVEQL